MLPWATLRPLPLPRLLQWRQRQLTRSHMLLFAYAFFGSNSLKQSLEPTHATIADSIFPSPRVLRRRLGSLEFATPRSLNTTQCALFRKVMRGKSGKKICCSCPDTKKVLTHAAGLLGVQRLVSSPRHTRLTESSTPCHTHQ